MLRSKFQSSGPGGLKKMFPSLVQWQLEFLNELSIEQDSFNKRSCKVSAKSVNGLGGNVVHMNWLTAYAWKD